MSAIVLCNLSDVNEIIEEERLSWMNDVFDALEIPDEVFDVSNISEYRAEMEELGIEIILYATGEVNVYKKTWYEGLTEETSGYLPVKKEHIVAQWENPTRIRRINGNEVYYELHLNEWSIANMRIK